MALISENKKLKKSGMSSADIYKQFTGRGVTAQTAAKVTGYTAPVIKNTTTPSQTKSGYSSLVVENRDKQKSGQTSQDVYGEFTDRGIPEAQASFLTGYDGTAQTGQTGDSQVDTSTNGYTEYDPLFDEKEDPETIEDAVTQTYEEQSEEQTPAEQAGSEMKGAYKDLADNAQKYGITLPFDSFQGFLDWKKTANQEDIDYLEGQQNIAREIEGSEAMKAAGDLGAAALSMTASMAQSREGAMGSSKPLVSKEYSAEMNRQKNMIELKRKSAENSRQRAMVKLKRAQESGDIGLVESIEGQISAIERNIEQQAIDARKVANEEAATVLNYAKFAETKTTNLVSSFESMGAGLADVAYSDLVNMTAGTNVTIPQALAFQKAAEIQKNIDNSKNENDKAVWALELEALKKENANIGKPASVQEWEYYNELLEGAKSEFLELQANGSSLVKMDNGDYAAYNSRTNEFDIIHRASDGGDFVPSKDNIDDASTGAGQNGILKYSTLHKGSSANADGVDYSAAIGTPVSAQLDGEVVFAGDKGGWGNRVSIKDNSGNIHTYNHLSQMNVNVGDIIGAGSSIGQVGNTGNVMAGDGSKLTPAQIASGRGAHLDYTVYRPDGSKYSLNEAYQFANGTQGRGLDTSTFEGQLMSDYRQTGESLGYKGEALQDFVDDRVNDSYKPMTDAQGKASKAYTVASKENERYDTLIEGADQEGFADAINYISSKIKDVESPLTAEIVNRATDNVTVRRAIMSEMRWLGAILREESGAAISVGEYLNKGLAFFPRAGDDTLSLEDKLDARGVEVNSLKSKMGASGQRELLEKEFEANKDKPVEIDFDTMWENSATDATPEDDTTWESL